MSAIPSSIVFLTKSGFKNWRNILSVFWYFLQSWNILLTPVRTYSMYSYKLIIHTPKKRARTGLHEKDQSSGLRKGVCVTKDHASIMECRLVFCTFRTCMPLQPWSNIKIQKCCCYKVGQQPCEYFRLGWKQCSRFRHAMSKQQRHY